MAYILGLWFANGYIYGGKFFDITLHKKDKYILKKVAEKLQYTNDLYDTVDQQSSRINFSCKVIYDDIISLIGSEEKTFPTVPKEYLPDFIRGFFDGKGDIMKLKNNRLNSTFTVKNKDFLFELQKVLKKEVGIIGGSYDASNYLLKFGKKDTLKIGKYIYQNDPELFLLRKRQKFF